MSEGTYTAREISLRSGSISRKGVAKLLRGLPADGLRVTRGGHQTPAWKFSTLAKCAPLLQRLTADARRKGYRDARSMFESALEPQPAVNLANIAQDELDRAFKLRGLLMHYYENLTMPASQRDQEISQRYQEVFGRRITTRYARKLFLRTLKRAAGGRDFQSLPLYLPDKPRLKEATDHKTEEPCLTEQFPELESALALVGGSSPPRPVQAAVWRAAFNEFFRLLGSGVAENRAAKAVRDLLHSRCLFLPRNRDTLLKLWNSKLDRFIGKEGRPGALADGRRNNGTRIPVPQSDVEILLHSAAFKNSGRIDTAWREDYQKLSQCTRARGSRHGRCPRAVANAVNRELVRGLHALRQGSLYLDRLLGTTTRNPNIPAMHAWVMDDLTCTLEVFLRNEDGSTSLRLVQFIGVMDVRSRKLVGWSASLDESPTAELVCEAFLDAVRRTGMVPHNLWLENGWVFGRANAIVGKRDESDDVIIAGLAEYGCKVRHFSPRTPTAKGELEKAFDLLQRRMERHPGYTGRAQRYDAPEQFAREQMEIRRRAKPRDPATCRYDFPQAVRAINEMVMDYNATPQLRGILKGLSPDQAFDALQDADNPPISLPPELHWLLGYRYRVAVKLSGVRFRHFGEDVRVRGGRLVNYIGRELWAVVDRRGADVVTFMTPEFSDVFTEPVRPIVPYDAAENDPEPLAIECETKAEHRGAIRSLYERLEERFGDPRKEFLRNAQAEPQSNARVPVVDPNFSAAGVEGERQRADLRRRSAQTGRANNRNSTDAFGDMASRPGFGKASKSIMGDNTQ
ncbi:MAG TPA: hypothetical protein PK157_21440 [Bryobacteraceae bacterium]|nr:hypothetical protein [Bryobacteraceae bacterium]